MRLFGLDIKRRRVPGAQRSAPVVLVRRDWSAADTSSDLYDDWKLDGGWVPNTVASQWITMVGRSRNEAKNNVYVRKILRMLVANVVGYQGFRFNAQARRPNGDLDVQDNETLERAWRQWATNPMWCDAAGRKTFRDHCRLLVKSWVRDGEHIVRILRGHNWPANPFAFSLKAYNAAALDVQLNIEETKRGTSIINGVEVDSWNRPVAYHFTARDKPAIYYDPYRYSGENHEVIPANEIIHLFDPDIEDQTRGMPWLHAALIRLHMQDKYDHAELEAARDAACSLGTYTADGGDDFDPVTTYESVQNSVQERAPGMREILPAGWKYEEKSPQRPNTAYPDFRKAQLQGVAAGADVGYNTLANDLDGVTYSSLRDGKLSERDAYMDLQEIVISHFCTRVYLAWLSMYLSTPLSKQPVSRYSKFAAHSWQGRRWWRTIRGRLRMGDQPDVDSCNTRFILVPVCARWQNLHRPARPRHTRAALNHEQHHAQGKP